MGTPKHSSNILEPLEDTWRNLSYVLMWANYKVNNNQLAFGKKAAWTLADSRITAHKSHPITYLQPGHEVLDPFTWTVVGGRFCGFCCVRPNSILRHA